MKVLFKAKTLLLNQELVSLDMLAAIQDFLISYSSSLLIIMEPRKKFEYFSDMIFSCSNEPDI